MVKRNVVTIGQCYESLDRVYMVVAPSGFAKIWIVQDTLSKVQVFFCERDLIKLRRPFQNFG